MTVVPVDDASMPGEPPVERDPIECAMIRTLFLMIPSQTGAAFVVGSFMVGTAYAFNPGAVVAGWGAAIMVASLLRWGISRAFARAQPPDSALRWWANLYAAAMGLIGILYGVSFLLFAHPDEPVTVALTLGALYSIAAGSTPACAYYFPSILTVVIPSFTAIPAKLLMTGDFGYILLGSASALYGVTMISYCKVQVGTLREGFRLRFENVQLIERLREETALADAARQAAEQATLAKSQFLAAASHDLRQPLYALGLFSSSLGDLKLSQEARGVVRRIQDSIGVMEKSFEGLLDLSKLEAGTVRPTLVPVAVDRLFDRLEQVFRPIAADRGLELRVRSNGEWVLSDPVLLEQALGNLVTNALRATAAGSVLLAVRVRGDDRRFEVWDTGKGIPPDDLERIFEEFVQLDNPQRDKRRGFGLGLAITQRSLALLGTRIELASRPGRGSVFAFRQPAADPRVAHAEGVEATALAVTRQGDEPVLVVDDDEDIRAALSNVLSNWGIAHELETAAEPALARLVQGGRFSLVITDQRLGSGMGGLDFALQARTALAAPPPMAIVTGELDPDLLARAAAAGIPVLHKPLNLATLKALLGRVEA